MTNEVQAILDLPLNIPSIKEERTLISNEVQKGIDTLYASDFRFIKKFKTFENVIQTSHSLYVQSMMKSCTWMSFLMGEFIPLLTLIYTYKHVRPLNIYVCKKITSEDYTQFYNEMEQVLCGLTINEHSTQHTDISYTTLHSYEDICWSEFAETHRSGELQKAMQFITQLARQKYPMESTNAISVRVTESPVSTRHLQDNIRKAFDHPKQSAQITYNHVQYKYKDNNSFLQMISQMSQTDVYCVVRPRQCAENIELMFLPNKAHLWMLTSPTKSLLDWIRFHEKHKQLRIHAFSTPRYSKRRHIQKPALLQTRRRPSKQHQRTSRKKNDPIR